MANTVSEEVVLRRAAKIVERLKWLDETAPIEGPKKPVDHVWIAERLAGLVQKAGQVIVPSGPKSPTLDFSQ